MQREILTSLRGIAGSLAPSRLGFVIGEVSRRESRALAPTTPRSVPLPPRVLEQARAIADPEIRRRFEEAAARYLARASA